MSLGGGETQWLWPTPIGLHRYPNAERINLFRSWLAHKAMPYDGDLERVIVSFNASLHAADGDQLHEYSPR